MNRLLPIALAFIIAGEIFMSAAAVGKRTVAASDITGIDLMIHT